MSYAMSGNEISEVVDGYLEAMAWANVVHEDGGDSSLSVEDLPPAVVAELTQDVREFLDEHTERLIQGAVRRGRYSFARAGHDYALTRNGHGAGFWDSGLGMIGDALTAISRPYGERTIYVSVDGGVSL